MSYEIIAFMNQKNTSFTQRSLIECCTLNYLNRIFLWEEYPLMLIEYVVLKSNESAQTGIF